MFGAKAGFFQQLALSGSEFRFIGIFSSRRQLPKKTAGRVPILAFKQNAAIRIYRQHHDGAGVPNHVAARHNSAGLLNHVG